MINSSSLESLKTQIDIVDTISNFIELKKSGANFKAPCPFHDEKSASFVVSPSKQICHCFGCGYSSDAIGFVQSFKKLTFVESIEDIANDMNFTLQYDSKEEKKEYKKIMEHINSYYITNLEQENIEYLLNRGITIESIKEFEIGFTTSSKQQLNHLMNESFNIKEAIECGVLATGEDGSTYARLSNRISFPIRNHTGKLIGFGGRITRGEGAKYINSPQTPLFDKSRNLYGYNLAKNHIYDKGTFVITEGYLDVVMMHQAGIKTAVATMGTALTEQHCNIIKKIKARVLLCFDGDKAGVNAAYKASKLLSSHDIYGGVVLFPEGKDPADMVKDGEIEELHKFMKNSTPLIEFAIKHIASQYNLNVPQQKQQALFEVQEFTKTLKPIIQDEYKHFIAKLLNIDVKHIPEVGKTMQTPPVRLQAINIAELNIIKTANEDEQLLDTVLEYVGAEHFEFHQREFMMLLSKDAAFQGLLLREELSIYTHEELLVQLKTILINYNTKQLQSIIHSNESYEKKSFEMKRLKGIIFNLKKDLRESAK